MYGAKKLHVLNFVEFSDTSEDDLVADFDNQEGHDSSITMKIHLKLEQYLKAFSTQY